ncbi:MAG: PEP-CTERM sorting domain-containing protein, partial [Nitrosospira sp.]
DTNAFGDRMHSSGTFNNNGTYNKQNNTLTNIDTGVDFNNTGTLNVQAGVFNVANTMTNAGVVNVSAGAIFQSSCGGADCFSNTGIMQGNGTIQTRINNELVNSGAINPGDSIGHLTIDGNLHQAANGAVNFELAGLHNFDQLTVTGDVTLGGDISLWNLGYTPVAGDSFVVATFDDRADTTFSSLSLHGFSPNTFQVFYHDHDVTVAVVPEPEQYLMLLAGLGLMGVVARRRRNCIRRCDETV